MRLPYECVHIYTVELWFRVVLSTLHVKCESFWTILRFVVFLATVCLIEFSSLFPDFNSTRFLLFVSFTSTYFKIILTFGGGVSWGVIIGLSLFPFNFLLYDFALWPSHSPLPYLLSLKFDSLYFHSVKFIYDSYIYVFPVLEIDMYSAAGWQNAHRCWLDPVSRWYCLALLYPCLLSVPSVLWSPSVPVAGVYVLSIVTPPAFEFCILQFNCLVAVCLGLLLRPKQLTLYCITFHSAFGSFLLWFC